MLSQIIQSRFAFFWSWDMSHGNPPQRIVWTVELLEPAFAITQDSAMRALIGILAQRLDTFPHRHIDNDKVIVIDFDAGGVTAFGLKPPHKTWS